LLVWTKKTLEERLKQLKGVAKFKLLPAAAVAASSAILLNNSPGCLHLITCISKKSHSNLCSPLSALAQFSSPFALEPTSYRNTPQLHPQHTSRRAVDFKIASFSIRWNYVMYQSELRATKLLEMIKN
jgi:hypothetical protein